MPCTDKNPLTREGTSLLTRVLAALDCNYARPDERNTEDLILFVRRYAERLIYYSKDNVPAGDWSPMITDVSVPLATLARIDLLALNDYKKRIYKAINDPDHVADVKEEFKYLFDFLFSVSKLVDDQFALLDNNSDFKKIFLDVVNTSLQQPLADIQSCFEDYKGQNLLDYSLSQLDNDAPVAVTSDANFTRAADLSSTWQTAVPDLTITFPVGLSNDEKIVYVINHNLFNAQVESLLNGISTVTKRANDLFVQALGDSPDHAPHFALFLAFAKIFAHAQDDLNGYTKRHLDFYYKRTLQLTNRVPLPDSAHLVFELQKPLVQQLLTKGTLFKGGKNAAGKETQYALADDVVINKATVSKLYSFQLVSNGNFLKASSVANSDDGQGAALVSADKSWFTFGDTKKIKSAKAGFAIASNIFYLNEGDRTVKIEINFVNDLATVVAGLDFFTAQFTGKKKWEDATLNVTMPSTKQLLFSISLSPDAPAIAPYAEKVHARNMGIDLPVVEIYVDQDANNAMPYTRLSRAEIKSVDITVTANGLKDLALSNDGGSIDASKPFKPFGDFPTTDSGFYIGSKEVSQKPLSSVTLNTTWKSLASGAPTLSTDVHYLRQGSFNSKTFGIKNFSGNSFNIDVADSFVPAAVDFSKNEALTATTREGFFRIALNETTYSLTQHLIDISGALSGTAITPQSGGGYTVATPATPVPKEVVLGAFSLDYTATVTITFAKDAPADNHLFYHVGPFGFSRVNLSLIDTSKDAEPVVNTALLPDVLNAGELFVGLQNAQPDTTVTILFEVAEGTSNPLYDMEELGWYYLSGNNWKILETEDIIDNTKNFTQSGVVTLTLPKDIRNDNTLFDTGLHWIKITAAPFADAVCKMILVQAQSARVQLVQDDAKDIEFVQLLSASSISKLVSANSAIKKIEQPFDSFGGRARETDDHFYVRVSERLRHKHRAINIWDYEHILLEQFPGIFKVRCINQAGFYQDQGKDVFCENFSGHVTIVTIPNQAKSSSANRLRPCTPIGVLNNISEYLQQIISPFVKLHVKPARFEEIQLDFKVSFLEHLDPSYYISQLNAEIEKFLCPWAYDDSVEISFGGNIYKSALMNFVEERPYVDFVTCFKMYHIVDRTDPLSDTDVATASTAMSVMVSYYDESSGTRHLISSPAICEC